MIEGGIDGSEGNETRNEAKRVCWWWWVRGREGGERRNKRVQIQIQFPLPPEQQQSNYGDEKRSKRGEVQNRHDCVCHTGWYDSGCDRLYSSTTDSSTIRVLYSSTRFSTNKEIMIIKKMVPLSKFQHQYHYRQYDRGGRGGQLLMATG